MKIQIPGTNLVRDTTSMALINQDKSGLDAYLAKRNLMASQKQEINNMKSDINNIREDLTEIKSLMLKLLDKTNG